MEQCLRKVTASWIKYIFSVPPLQSNPNLEYITYLVPPQEGININHNQNISIIVYDYILVWDNYIALTLWPWNQNLIVSTVNIF